MSETQIQNKIISIEKFILKFSELNVRGQIKASKKKIDMRISKRQKLVGSAAITGNIITNDYDLNEIYKLMKESLNHDLIITYRYKKKYNVGWSLLSHYLASSEP